MSKNSELEQLIGMVPFYVNGTLDGDDKAKFDAALSSSEELQSEVARETELQKQFNAAMDAELGPESANRAAPAMPQGLLNIPSAGNSNADFQAKPSGLMGAMSFLNPANWKPAVTFALAAAAVGQAAFIGGQAETISSQGEQIASLEKRNFELASGQGDCTGVASIILEPTDNAAWADLNSLISDEGLSVTGGGFGGPLMLRHKEGGDSLDDILSRLNASPLVSSAVAAS